MMEAIGLLVSFVLPLFAMLGFGAFVFLLLLKIPSPIQDKLSWKMWHSATIALFPSKLVMLIRRNDGDYTFREAQYDEANQGYWINAAEDKKHFYQSTGQPLGSFGPIRLIPAYEGFGVASDFIAAQIAEECEKKFIHHNDKPVLDEDGNQIQEVVSIPSRGIVDLRKLKYLAPFNVDPDRGYRIEENAKAAMQHFKNRSELIQGMMIISAFVIGSVMTWFVMTQAGGGGGLPSINI